MKHDSFSGIVILADGSFPSHEVSLGYLKNASAIVCCDGAADNLVAFGLEPKAIVGDCDSLSEMTENRFSDRIFRNTDQETNDLTKAFRWCVERGFRDIVILGATGKREDHTLGNISLLADYGKLADVRIITDTGTFIPLLYPGRIKTWRGQQISIFSLNPATEITSTGLKYPLDKMRISNWWQATLNEATGETVMLSFETGPLLVFLEFER